MATQEKVQSEMEVLRKRSTQLNGAESMTSPNSILTNETRHIWAEDPVRDLTGRSIQVMRELVPTHITTTIGSDPSMLLSSQIQSPKGGGI